MAWKKRFAPTIRIHELVNCGPMRIDDEPEALGQGKYRVRATLKDGSQITFSTFESTIGNINEAAGPKGWAEAYGSDQLNKSGNPYINWRTWEGE